MPKQDIIDLLMTRLRHIGHAIREARSPHAWGWTDGWHKYDHHEPLEVKGYDGGDWIWLDRVSQARSALNIFGMAPLGRLRGMEENKINAGGVTVIDGATVPFHQLPGAPAGGHHLYARLPGHRARV